MTIEMMRTRKRELGYSNEKLAELSGVPLTTIQKILSGTTRNPRYDTLSALEAALAAPSVVREEASVYGTTYDRQGSYTIDDYYALPDDQRVELIDGVFYDMTAPIPFHQLAIGTIYVQIANYIKENGGDCMVFLSPTDVQLDCDNRTMVEPDIFILCDRNLITRKNIYGAPDFILEVISPSTKRKDYTIKLNKYLEAGVKEYWIVDPYTPMIFTYVFGDESRCPAIYPIDGDVPVTLYHDDLKINLRDILQWLPEKEN